MNAKEEFWSSYYGDVVKTGNAWLDYSNERVQVQTFGLALEAAGPIRNRRCLDVGCGWGHFSRLLDSLGAASVTGLDIVPDMIAHHEREYPQIRWMCGSLSTGDLSSELGPFDVVFLLEVLQYLPFPDVLRTVWNRLLPGGRIVAVVPNGNCPIVSRTRSRFGDRYAPLTVAQIEAALGAWPDVECVEYRGWFFGRDQRNVPYEISPWRSSGGWDVEPNRLQLVAIKSAAPLV
jgi:2-polyprenyl-3-methyl-5-hydroxy-6-metoxy-1,4-benzoquinol methylase